MIGLNASEIHLFRYLNHKKHLNFSGVGKQNVWSHIFGEVYPNSRSKAYH